MENKENSWISCVGKFQAICHEFQQCNEILSNMKNSKLPNPILFLINSLQCISSINNDISNYISCATKVLDDLTMEDEFDNTSSAQDSFVEHDPGKRTPIITTFQRQFLISLGPHQPKLARYPRNNSISANKQQNFTSKWFNEFPLLEYSIVTDSVFCFVCSLFSHKTDDNPWVSSGLKQWHKMKSRGNNKKGKLIQHFSSEFHKKAMLDYCAFISQSSRIDFIFDKSVREVAIRHKHEQEFNRKAVGILFDVARTLGRQGLAFRSHKENENESQDGNFYQIVLLLSRHCPTIKRWLNDKNMRPYHVTYLGSQSQNEFIELLAAATRKTIIQEISNSELFSVMADTTPDVSLKDQLAVCVRYIDSNGKINERLLDVIEASNKTGYGIAKYIYDSLIKHNINTDNVAFQSYDFASNMSGHNKGAQRFFTELVGHSVPYIPCQAHRMNTFIEHSCDASPIIGELFNVLENIYVFFSFSTKRFKDLADRMKEIEGSLQLRNISKTRWTARAESIKSVWTSLNAIVETLKDITTSNKFDSLTKAKALGLKKKILNYDFFVSLVFMKNIMYKLKNLTEHLEAKELNVCDAVILINSTICSIKNIRLDSENMNNLIESSKKTAQLYGVDPDADYKRHHRIKRVPKRIDINTDNTAKIDLLTFYRKQFNQVLDTLLNLSNENLRIFVEKLQPVFNILQIPLKFEYASAENITKAFSLFPPKSQGGQLLDFDAVAAEWEILCHQCTNFETIFQVNEKSHELQKLLPWANWLCRLASTAPVSTASNERTFSKLKLIKHSLRSTMNTERLNSLMILKCEKDISDKIDIDYVLEKWSSAKQRRIEI